MNDSSKPNQDETFLCWILIGLYAVVFAVAALFYPFTVSLARDLAYSSWRILARSFAFRELPVLSADDLLGCAAQVLAVAGVFLFSQYCFRLRAQHLLVSHRALWLLTGAHALGIVVWLLYAGWQARHALIPNGNFLIVPVLCAVPLIIFLSALVPLSSSNNPKA